MPHIFSTIIQTTVKANSAEQEKENLETQQIISYLKSREKAIDLKSKLIEKDKDRSTRLELQSQLIGGRISEFNNNWYRETNIFLQDLENAIESENLESMGISSENPEVERFVKLLVREIFLECEQDKQFGEEQKVTVNQYFTLSKVMGKLVFLEETFCHQLSFWFYYGVEKGDHYLVEKFYENHKLTQTWKERENDGETPIILSYYRELDLMDMLSRPLSPDDDVNLLSAYIDQITSLFNKEIGDASEDNVNYENLNHLMPNIIAICRILQTQLMYLFHKGRLCHESLSKIIDSHSNYQNAIFKFKYSQMREPFKLSLYEDEQRKEKKGDFIMSESVTDTLLATYHSLNLMREYLLKTNSGEKDRLPISFWLPEITKFNEDKYDRIRNRVFKFMNAMISEKACTSLTKHIDIIRTLLALLSNSFPDDTPYDKEVDGPEEIRKILAENHLEPREGDDHLLSSIDTASFNDIDATRMMLISQHSIVYYKILQRIMKDHMKKIH